MATYVSDDGPNSIVGSVGDDYIDALGGNDTVLGDAGSDTIYGGLGNDRLFGGDGYDVVDGGDGNDELYGGADADWVSGGAGDDFLQSGGGGGVLHGGPGNDVLFATDDAGGLGESLIGDDGDDRIHFVGARNLYSDTVDAGAGNDKIYLWVQKTGSGDYSVISLGEGQDTITPFNAPTWHLQAIITDFEPGLAGDVLELDYIISSLVGYNGENPFGSGFIQLAQDGPDTLFQVDPDGAANGSAWVTLFRFQNTTATSFVASNFSPAWPPDGSTPLGQNIVGDDGPNSIVGSVGDDYIDALGGNDTVLGDAGSDTIYGGLGNDYIMGGYGDDVLNGSGGNDQIYGGIGSDTIYGEDGDDFIQSDGGGGAIDGGSGNDTIYAGADIDGIGEIIFGGEGDDNIQFVGAWNINSDTVDAGAGNDKIYLWVQKTGSGDHSVISIGEGQDTIIAFNRPTWNFQAVISDFITGTDGDVIDISQIIYAFVGYNGENPFGSGFIQLTQDGPDTLFQVDPDGAANGSTWVTLFRFQNTTATSFVASNFSPAWPPDGSTPPGLVITGDDSSNTLLGTVGDDQLSGLGGNDTLSGDAGSDTIYGGPGADFIIGGYGNDLINSGGTVSLKFFESYYLNAYISNSIEIDTLSGGQGSDTLIGDGPEDFVSYSLEIDQGGNRGVYVDLASGFAMDCYGSFDQILTIANVIGTDGGYAGGPVGDNELSDVLIGSAGANRIEGLGGLDYILGSGGADTILAGSGNDNAFGGAGNDSLLGGNGADFLFGEDGSDTLFGEAGDDWLIGAFWSGPSTGVDVAYGGAGNDVIAVGDSSLTTSVIAAYGEAGNDIIYGGGGADWLVGGTGSDYLWGAGGADVFRFEAADLVAGDVDTVLMGFGEGDLISFAASLTGQVSAIAGSSAGVAGVYLTVAVTGGTWFGWVPYQTLAGVEAALVYG